MRRPRGEAADLILKALHEVHPEGLTMALLRQRTRLPSGTVSDNVRDLRKRGSLETFKDDDGKVWVCLPE